MKISLEEANEIARRNGYGSYGGLHQELYRHGITLEQFKKNGESFEKKQAPKKVVAKRQQVDQMPESVFNAITKRILDLKDQKANLEKAKGTRLKAEITHEKKRIDIEIRELTVYQKAHYGGEK